MGRRLSVLVMLATICVALLPSAAAGGFCHPDKGLEMKSSSKRSVTIDRCAFVQTVTYVEPGDTVTWVNEDVFPHSVTGAALAWGDEDLLDQTDEVSYEFEDEGVYPYYCALHPSMVGAVVVGDGGATVALGAGDAPVKKAGDPATANAGDAAPAESGGGPSPMLVVVSLAAALAAVALATRYALLRRAGAPSPS